MNKIEPKDKIIAIIEDDDGLRFLIQKRLQQAGFTTFGFADENELFGQLEKIKDVSLLLLDYKLPNTTATIILENLQQQHIHKPFIIITGHGDEKKAVEMMKLGALDYIVKDEHFFNMLIPVILQAFKQIENKYHLLENLQATKEQDIYKFVKILFQQNNLLIAALINGLRRNGNNNMLQSNKEKFIEIFAAFKNDNLQHINAKNFIDDLISVAKLLFPENKITYVNSIDNESSIELKVNILFYALLQIIEYSKTNNDFLKIIFILKKVAEKNLLQLLVDKNILSSTLIDVFDSSCCYEDNLVYDDCCRILLCKMFVVRGLNGNVIIKQNDNSTEFNIIF